MKDNAFAGMKWVRGRYGLGCDTNTNNWAVTFEARARSQLKDHPHFLTQAGVEACKKEELHIVQFSTPYRYTFEEADHLRRELEAGRREGKKLSRQGRRKRA